MGFFGDIINLVLWLPVKMILQVLWGINETVNWLTQDLLDTILFGGNVSDWSKVLVPSTYYRMALIAIIFSLLVMVMTFLTHIFKDLDNSEDTPLSKKILKSVKGGIIGIIVIVFIPLIIWLMTKMSLGLQLGLNAAFGGESTNIADMLYNMGNPSWDGVMHASENGNYPFPPNIGEWNMLVEILGLSIVFIALLLVMVNLVVIIFTIFFYFVMTAWYSMLWIFDGGKRMREYMTAMMGNMLILCGMNLIFNIYSSLLGIMNTTLSNSTDMNSMVEMLLTLVISIAGAVFVLKGDEFISGFIGQNIPGVGHAKDALGLVMAGGAMAFGAARLAGKASIGKKNWARKKEAKAAGFKNARAYDRSLSGDGSSGAQGSPVGRGATSAGGERMGSQERAEMLRDERTRAVKQTYRKGGIFGAMGASLRGATATVAGSVLVGKSLFGGKATRMVARNEIKSNVGGVFGSVGRGLKNTGSNIAEMTGYKQSNLNVSNRKMEALSPKSYKDSYAKKIVEHYEGENGKINEAKKQKTVSHVGKYKYDNKRNIVGAKEHIQERKAQGKLNLTKRKMELKQEKLIMVQKKQHELLQARAEARIRKADKRGIDTSDFKNNE